MAAFAEIGSYLADTITSLYLIIVVLRGILQGSQADAHNPISTFIAQATNPPLRLIRKVVPTGKRFDLSIIVLALIVQATGMTAVIMLSGFMPPNPFIVLVWSALGVLGLLVNTYLVALIAMIVVSWIAPASRHPAIILLYQITQPVMIPFRSLLPNMGGLDFSPILLFILINVIQIALRHVAVATGLPINLVMGI